MNRRRERPISGGPMLRLLTTLGLAAALHAEPLPLATGEWPPFVSATLPDSGAAAALVALVCREAGWPPGLRFLPWVAALQAAGAGEAAAAFPFVAAERLERGFLFSDTLFTGINAFVYHAGRRPEFAGWSFAGLEGLRRWRIGVLSGSFYEGEFLDAGLTCVRGATLDECLDRLVAGEVDLCLDNPAVVYDSIRRRHPQLLDSIRVAPGVYGERRPNVLVVPRVAPGAPELLARFHAGFQRAVASGAYDEVLARHRMVR